MAYSTIEKRKKTNGDFSYRCTIRVKKNGEIIHRESKTFSKKELARTWAKLRIDEIELEGIANKRYWLGIVTARPFSSPNAWCALAVAFKTALLSMSPSFSNGTNL